MTRHDGIITPARARALLYCIVPRDLSPAVCELARGHWRTDPSVVVLCERREDDRRRGAPDGGRRVGDRRSSEIVRPPSRLPSKLREYASRLTFARRRVAGQRDPEEVDSDRLVVSFQGGDRRAFDRLHSRYRPRVHTYAWVALHDGGHDVEDVVQNVFIEVMHGLPHYQVREDSSFRAWLFRIARDIVLEAREGDGLGKEPPATGASSVAGLSNDDLARLLRRLPHAQQEVVLLRHVFGFGTWEIAQALDRSAAAVRMLEHRAMRAFEARLHAPRGTRGSDRLAFAARSRPSPVVFRRRFALVADGAAPL